MRRFVVWPAAAAAPLPVDGHVEPVDRQRAWRPRELLLLGQSETFVLRIDANSAGYNGVFDISRFVQ
jgi:hypothetical protein